MKNIKRLFVLTLLALITGVFSLRANAQADFQLNIKTREIQNVMGVQHQKFNVVMRFNGVNSNQQINYIGANLVTNKNVSLVALDNYSLDDFERGTILQQIENSQKRYPNQKIVAAVNGDGFDINSTIGQDAATLNGRKMIIKTDETIIHRGPGDVELGRYFINGKLLEITSEEIDEIAEGTMVLMGDDFFLEDLITSTDTVRLQNKLSDKYSDVYQAISGSTLLVSNGEVRPQTNKDIHPRTSAGIKADGTVFFVTVDGRQAPAYEGVTYEQLGYIMKHFGAETAFNLDGGGSTTVAVYDNNLDDYVIHNSPSDGNLRRDGNAVGFIFGERDLPLKPIPYPDTREVLEPVSGIFIEGNKLSFAPVENASRYIVYVGGAIFETTNTELFLEIDPGFHDVSIIAYGDYEYYNKSEYAEFVIETYSSAISNVLDVLYSYGSKTHKYLND